MKISADLRAASDHENGTLPISWGIRPAIKVARKTRVYPIEKAFRRAIADSLDPTTRELVHRTVRTYVDDGAGASDTHAVWPSPDNRPF